MHTINLFIVALFLALCVACSAEQPDYQQRLNNITNTEIVRQTQFSATRYAATSPTPSRTPTAIRLRPTATSRLPLSASDALARTATARAHP
jgi:hypothetical protein